MLYYALTYNAIWKRIGHKVEVTKFICNCLLVHVRKVCTSGLEKCCHLIAEPQYYVQLSLESFRINYTTLFPLFCCLLWPVALGSELQLLKSYSCTALYIFQPSLRVELVRSTPPTYLLKFAKFLKIKLFPVKITSWGCLGRHLLYNNGL